MHYSIYSSPLYYVPEFFLIGLFAVLVLFLYHRVGLLPWIGTLGLSVILLNFFHYSILSNFFAIVFFVLLFLAIKPLRLSLISKTILLIARKAKLVPKISDTERIAVESGTAWMDGELFSGSPNISALTSPRPRPLTKAEQAFLDGPVAKVCEMTNDFEVYQKRGLSKEIWNYLKKQKFFGMIIPKEYGGLGFSARAHSMVVEKLASRSYPLSITVMVPNSLGPAELLMHYGSDAQKKYYLPRLATGQEIPCFGLTELNAGSDAGAITSQGVVFKNSDGKIAIRLNWQKRYITLAAVSTIIGLAFRLEDPKNLLGKGTSPGITCALIPSKKKGVVLGRRHDPLGVPFYNCPIDGKDVIIGLENIIGEKEGVGQGLKMLMECLAAGRGISLPSTATGTSKLTSLVSANYCFIRQQFGASLYQFEGVVESLAYIFANTYLLNATKDYVLSGIDAGAKPPVVSAICKYHFTEIGRQVINRGMDTLAGAAISRGPRNLLAHSYFATPISITVEGANIMTRSLIIFNQGLMRCHPYLYNLICSIEKNDAAVFDKNLFAMIGRMAQNKTRFYCLALTRGFSSPSVAFRKNGKHWRRLVWASATFAFWADFVLGVYGPTIKFRERTAARLGDVLSQMLLISAVLNDYESKKCPEEEKHLFEWSVEQAFYNINQAMLDFYQNFFSTRIAILKPFVLFYRYFLLLLTRLLPYGTKPSDVIEKKIVNSICENPKRKDKLAQGIFVPKKTSDALGRLEETYKTLLASRETYAKIKKQLRKKGIRLNAANFSQTLKDAISQKAISAKDAKLVEKWEKMRSEAVKVDAFDLKKYMSYSTKPV